MSEQFDHPALNEMYAALQALKDAEEQVKVAKQHLHDAVLNLPSKIGENDDLQDEIFHQLYWFHEDVPGNLLKEAFQIRQASQTKKNALNRIMRDATLEVICIKCNQPYHIKVTSRHDMQMHRSWIASDIKHANSFNAGWARTCDTCKAKRDTRNNELYKQEQRQREERLAYLQTMPYRDYLQTPEWEETRKKALKRAGFRCQICNAYGVRLNVHHRTYERRGNEDNRDLITLCEKCHGIFHENSKLVREV